MRRLIVLALLLFPLLGNAVDTYYSGTELRDLCNKAAADAPRSNACLALIGGVSDLISVTRKWEPGLADRYPCIPEGVTLEELRQVWLKFAGIYPEYLKVPASSLLVTAFRDEWRCK